MTLRTVVVGVLVGLAGAASARAFDPLTGDYSKASPQDVRIVTYNHNRSFIEDASEDAAFNRILTALNPDILCMQEFTDAISESDVTNRLNTILPTAGGWHVHFGLLGGIRTVLVSRYPMMMTRVDTDPPSSTRGVTIALVDLPDGQFATDVYLLGVHLKCCGDPGGSEDASRQDSADAIANWLGDARGVARPSGDNIVLPVDTPMIALGDFNLVGGPQPETTILGGDIQDEGMYGPDVAGDWDATSLTNLMPEDPFTGDTFTWQGNGNFPPSALDRFFVTDSAVTVGNAFILNTDTMTPAALAAAGLQAGDTLPATTSDHLPVVVDVRISGGAPCSGSADCDDGLFCNGPETCDGLGVCQPGTPPCVGTGCSEAFDTCGGCVNDAACIDGNACTTDVCVDAMCVQVCPSNVAAFPFSSTFEVDLGAWRNVAGDDIDWTRQSGSTQSNNTGPSGDHTSGTGFYLYTEASGEANPDKVALLEGPCMDLGTAGAATLTFWRHMRGDSMGTLSVEVSTDCASWATVFSLGGDQGDAWIEETVDLTPFAGSVTTTIRFRGVTGSGFRSDMAIDDVTVTVGGCGNDAACSDGTFCNGAETCVGGNCVPGAAPCDASAWCAESVSTCVPYGDGDFEPDGDVDLADFQRFQRCFGLLSLGGCEPANLVGDGVVDAADLEALAGLLVGP